MRNLSDILIAQTNEELVLSRDIEGWIIVPGTDRGETNPDWRRENGQVFQRVTVQVALERTAVVYTSGRVDQKFLQPIARVFLEEAAIRWLPRNPTELRELRSRQQGQVQGRLAHGRTLVAATDKRE